MPLSRLSTNSRKQDNQVFFQPFVQLQKIPQKRTLAVANLENAWSLLQNLMQSSANERNSSGILHASGLQDQALIDQQHDLLLDGLAQRRPALDEQLQLRVQGARENSLSHRIEKVSRKVPFGNDLLPCPLDQPLQKTTGPTQTEKSQAV